jgi:peptidoglycan/LPS O-acetylase OafA/YrhL
MRYTHIQGLRGILCFLVAVIHVKIWLLRGGDPSWFALVPDALGAIPTAFFVISGFFMATLIDANSKHFIVMRLLRVYPMYFGAILVWIGLQLLMHRTIILDGLPRVLSLLPFGSGDGYKLGIEWTLVYEIWYYFVCALFANRIFSPYFKHFLFGWLLFVLAFNVSTAFPSPTFPSMITVWPSLWNVSFIAGGLLYHFTKEKNWGISKIVLVVSCALCLTCYEFHSMEHGFLILQAMEACLLVFLAIKLESWCASPKWLSTLGDYSYSLYLIHTTIILATFSVWSATYRVKPGPLAGVVSLIMVLGVATLLGRTDVFVYGYLRKRVALLLGKPRPREIRLVGGPDIPAFQPEPALIEVALADEKGSIGNRPLE